jgi:hypothetical protein
MGRPDASLIGTLVIASVSRFVLGNGAARLLYVELLRHASWH